MVLFYLFLYMEKEIVIKQTQNWVREVVVGLNLCPFAAKEVKNNTIKYVVLNTTDVPDILEAVYEECEFLDANTETETTLIIFPNATPDFEDYLDMLSLAEDLLEAEEYEGVYQIASFHPEYCFEDSDENDAANFSNKSPYPMFHLLRENSIDEAVEKYPNTEAIPDKNVELLRSKGLEYMKKLRDACLKNI